MVYTVQSKKKIKVLKKVGLKFAPIGSTVPSHKSQLPKASQTVSVYLGTIRLLKVLVIEISNAKKIFSPRICSIAQPPPPPQKKKGVYAAFLLYYI